MFNDVGGMIEINTGVYYYVKVLTTDTFEIYKDYQLTQGLDTTNFTAYSTSNGTATTFGGFRDEYQSENTSQVENLTNYPRAGPKRRIWTLILDNSKLVAVNQQLVIQYPHRIATNIPDLKVRIIRTWTITRNEN